MSKKNPKLPLKVNTLIFTKNSPTKEKRTELRKKRKK
jgi:hypothetical protein